MDDELIKTIESRLEHRDSEKIDAIARQRALHADAEEALTSDANIVRERAIKFGKALLAVRQRMKSSLLASRRQKAKDKIEYFRDIESVPMHTVDFTKSYFKEKLKLEIVDGSEETILTGWRTNIFGDEIDRHVGGNKYKIGWQAGLADSKTVFTTPSSGIGSADPKQFTLENGIVQIWRSVREENSTEENEARFYQIDVSSGEVATFTDGKRDDELISKGKQAGPHVLRLLDMAIEYLEQ